MAPAPGRPPRGVDHDEVPVLVPHGSGLPAGAASSRGGLAGVLRKLGRQPGRPGQSCLRVGCPGDHGERLRSPRRLLAPHRRRSGCGRRHGQGMPRPRRRRRCRGGRAHRGVPGRTADGPGLTSTPATSPVGTQTLRTHAGTRTETEDEQSERTSSPTSRRGGVRAVKPVLTVLLTSVAYFMVTLDALVVVTALPSIHRSLGGGIGTLQWTISAYTIVFGAGILTAAALGDRLGRRRAYVFGLALFTMASAACALAPNAEVLVA